MNKKQIHKIGKIKKEYSTCNFDGKGLHSDDKKSIEEFIAYRKKRGKPSPTSEPKWRCANCNAVVPADISAQIDHECLSYKREDRCPNSYDQEGMKCCRCVLPLPVNRDCQPPTEEKECDLRKIDGYCWTHSKYRCTPPQQIENNCPLKGRMGQCSAGACMHEPLDKGMDWADRFDKQMSKEWAYTAGDYTDKVKSFIAQEIAQARQEGYDMGESLGFDAGKIYAIGVLEGMKPKLLEKLAVTSSGMSVEQVGKHWIEWVDQAFDEAINSLSGREK